MPYTKTPTTNTYSQEDISLTREWSSRQGDPLGLKDEQFLNCFPEIIKSKILQDSRSYIMKRAGSSVYVTPAVSGEIRGMFYWKDTGKLLYCISDDVYMYNVSSGATTTMNAVFGTTSGEVGFCTYLYDNGTIKVVATDGTTLVTITNTAVVAASVSPDLPTPHIPKPVFIDGYLMLAEEDTASLWNSDLNDPLSWTAGNYINAEMDGDQLVTIEKLNNYILAFGSTTIEYFWDAGVATGSPFQRNETPIKVNRIIGGITKYGNTLFYIGATESGQLDVYKLQDFQIEPVGTTTITRYLNSLSDEFTTYSGHLVSCLGHTFYLVNAGTRTFVYDVDTRVWLRWSYQTEADFNITRSVMLHKTNSIVTAFTLGATNIIYILDDSVYQDNLENFVMRVVTEPVDFGTLNRKSMPKLSVIADTPSGDSTVTLYWSDDDFQTYNDGVEIELNQDLPSVTRLGSFRQRAFRVNYFDNYPLRIQKLQVNINKGRN